MAGRKVAANNGKKNISDHIDHIHAKIPCLLLEKKRTHFAVCSGNLSRHPVEAVDEPNR